MKMSTAAAALLLAACAGTLPTDSTGHSRTSEPGNPAQGSPAVAVSVIAVSPTSQAGWAEFNAKVNPTVRVLDKAGFPVVGASVKFTVSQGNGSASKGEVITDQSGTASSEWLLGSGAGTNTLIVSVAGVANPAVFTAEAAVVTIVARYDLSEIGGQSLPISYAGGGVSWVVTGGHYMITSDDQYAFGYEKNGISHVTPNGTVVRVDANTIQFVMSPDMYPLSQFYRQLNGLFATGHIAGDVMTVTYEDFVDFEPETYIRAK